MKTKKEIDKIIKKIKDITQESTWDDNIQCNDFCFDCEKDYANDYGNHDNKHVTFHHCIEGGSLSQLVKILSWIAGSKQSKDLEVLFREKIQLNRKEIRNSKYIRSKKK